MERAYLEHMFGDLGDRTPEFHDRLVFNYLRAIMLGLAGSDEAEVARVLEVSDAALLEERAILLSRLKRHGEALEIYVEKLKGFRDAQEYCDRHYSPDDAQSKDIYFQLLVLLLAAHGRGELDMEDVLSVLDKYGRRVDGAKALAILPADTRVTRLVAFAAQSLAELERRRRLEDAAAGLARSERLQTRYRLLESQRGRVSVTEDRMCARCLKRIGNSVFAAHPDGVIVHVFCQS
ncbi:Vam6/Vps39-like protein [Cladochytrium tenue]|nr:Vam6/Vps39-like protein [Cladochytrium tenue]